tara:strand:- start:40 stop:234 length:195 start_codon:yes stop_codon:yes gene_type:complete
MCLGGGGQSYEPPKYLSRTDPPPGPASPPDMVNDKEIAKTGDFSQKPKAEKKTTNRSTLNTGMY